MDRPGWRLHLLKGGLAGHWAVWVDENWRLTFKFEGTDAVLVDYQDYSRQTISRETLPGWRGGFAGRREGAQ